MPLHLCLRLLLSALVTCIAATSYASSGIFVGNNAELSATTRDGVSIRVIVQKIAPPSDYPIRGGFHWGGDDTEIPKALVISVQTWVGGDKIFILTSAYADLGDPRSVSLEATRNGCVIKIDGGDAAGSYSAILSIDNGNILRRRVISGEFPDKVWEETTYSFISRDESM